MGYNTLLIKMVYSFNFHHCANACVHTLTNIKLTCLNMILVINMTLLRPVSNLLLGDLYTGNADVYTCSGIALGTL